MLRLLLVLLFVGGMVGTPGLNGAKVAHAAESYSTGTTDPNKLPAKASAKVQALYPGWTQKSYSVQPGAIVIGAVNAKGTKAKFVVTIVSRMERGRMTYWVGNVAGPNPF